jgi:hypothetical protein
MGERFVLLPEIASNFGVRARSLPGTTPVMAAERSTIGSALFLAHQLKRLQGERYQGFEITSMLTHEGEEEAALPVHSLGWAFDVPASSLSSKDERDLKFILTDLRHAGLLAYVEEDDDSTFHIVRHPDHASRFEQFYWDVMAGAVPTFSPPQIGTVAGGTPGTDRSGLSVEPRPRVLVALSSFFSRVFSFFSFD